MSTQSGHEGRFEIVDVLRGLAALCVVASHYTSFALQNLGSTPFHVPQDAGRYAVDLFFVISGFVILFSLERSRTAADFAFSRFSRLYPAFIVSLVVVSVLQVSFYGGSIWWPGYLANATMLQEFLGFENFDVVYWSLTVEIAFYAVMALVLAAGLLPRLELICAVWLAVAALWFGAQSLLQIQLPAWVPRLLALGHIPLFVAGIVFRRSVSDGMSPRRWLLLLGALGCEWIIRGAEGLAVTLVCLVIFALALRGWLSVLVSRGTLWLGAISYSLYISHRNLGYSVLAWLHECGVPVPAALALTTCGALALATALHHFVERPAQSALRAWYRRRQALFASVRDHAKP